MDNNSWCNSLKDLPGESCKAALQTYHGEKVVRAWYMHRVVQLSLIEK